MASGRCEWIDDPARFSELEERWEALVDNDPLPFSRHAWFAAWWKAFGAGRRLSICALWREGELAAVLPLWRRGRRLEAMANVHTPVFAPLARDAEALEVLLDEVLRVARAELALSAVPVEWPTLCALRSAAARAGRVCHEEPQHTSPIVETVGSYAAYRSKMKSRWSSSERKARKMAREHDARFDLVSVPTALDEQLARGLRVEGSGWKGRKGTAIQSSADTLTFYRSIATSFARRGELRLSEIALDGEPVAFDLCLLSGARLYLLKTGYDESRHTLSPGLVLRQMVVERCFELGLEAHELLGDDSEWKRRFATGSRAQTSLRTYERRPVPLARYAYRRLARPVLQRGYRALRERSDGARASGAPARGAWGEASSLP